MASTIYDLFETPPNGKWTDATVEDAEVKIRFGDLAALLHRRAANLRASGIVPGDRVLVSCKNSVDWILSTLAVMRIGAIAAPIDPAATGREINVYERIIEPAGVIAELGCDEDLFHTRIIRWDSATQNVRDSDIGPPPQPDDSALILFTSGTTGTPKAAVQRHSTLIYSGQGVVHWLGLTPADRLLVCMPLFHANAIYYSLMGALCAGAGLTVLPRFSVSRFWDSVRSTGATEVNLMGPMLSMLLRQPPKADDADNPLRLVYTAAAAPDVAATFMSRFGVQIVEGYGMTETPYGCINPRSQPKWGSVGLPRQHPQGAIKNEVRIAGENGAALADGEVGQIMIRNDATFSEYWGNATATDAAFDDGWFRTGDLGYRDGQGYFHIAGRMKEIIRRNGVNISPAEIELVMRDVAFIDDAALVALPNPLGEELAVLAVTLPKGASDDAIEDRVLSELRRHLSREKVPDRVFVVDDIPRTHTQRIERGKLQEWLKRNVSLAPAAERP